MTDKNFEIWWKENKERLENYCGSVCADAGYREAINSCLSIVNMNVCDKEVCCCCLNDKCLNKLLGKISDEMKELCK
jgi:hypothetical protein